jgi:acid stress chaperone HdeA
MTKASQHLATRIINGADPSSLEISATRLSPLTYCQTVGKPDSKISEAPHG